MKKGILATIGFFIFATAFISIILRMIGLNLQIWDFLENFGTLAAFIIKLVIMITGVLMMYYDLNKDKWLEDSQL